MAEKENALRPPQQVFFGVRVGLVTEAENVAQILKKSFENRGADVEVFLSGKAAIKAAKEAPLDVLVVASDVKYHGADWVSKEVRVRKNPEIPVLWYLGRTNMARFDGYTAKPFRPIELLKPIFLTLQSYRQGKVDEDDDLEDSLRRRKKIILIDDEEGLRFLGETILEKEGYQVITACNGKEGLDIVAAHPNFAAVLVDLNMPKMNGFEFVQALRNMNVDETKPIIIITSHTQEETLALGKKLKITAWISKPYKKKHLIETVRRSLSSIPNNN